MKGSEKNEIIRLWADDKGIFPQCDYSIYENIAPVLDEARAWFSGYTLAPSGDGRWIVDARFWINSKPIHKSESIATPVDLPTPLRDMVAELIDKGEV